ncbi:MAG: InlB B-repeat-containing protein [Myxococcales bacterium]|nr:InlB B-repeat-containing protein [Myxococcales bacterium]
MRASLSVLAAAALLAVPGCGSVESQPDAPTTATLTVTTTGDGVVASSPGGIACGSTCAATFDLGTAVTLTATPGAAATFAGWSGACSGTAPTCTLTIAAATTVGATFAVLQRTVTVVPTGDGSGTIESSPAGLVCPGACTLTVAHGTVVTLTPHPALGATFAGWTGGGCTGAAPCVLTVTADVSIQAAFALDHTLVVTRAGSGSGTVTSNPPGITCGGDCSETYAQGTVVTLTATPDGGSTFAGWSGACAGTGTCMVTMDAAQTVTANFTLGQYTLTVSRTGTGVGTITSNPAGITCGADCTEDYGFGTSVSLTATPAAGSSFGGWGGACSGTGACAVSITGMTTVTATFTLNQYTLTVTRAGTGTGTVTSSPAGITCGADCTEVYNHGTAVTLTAAPAAGSTFSGWSGACTGTGTCAVTLTAATSVTATFALVQYTLTVARAGTGTGTVTSSPTGISCGTDCSQPYNAGTVVTLTATAAAGSYFAGWSGGCTGTGTCAVTVTAAQTISATFTLRGSVYAIRDSDDMFQRGNPDTGAIADVGLLGVTYAFGDCAYNSATGAMYMVDGRGAKGLYRVSLTTGAATLVGTHNVADMFALAYDAGNGFLYGIAGDGNLYRFSTTTGAATLIGATGASGTINGLAWDSTRNRLVGLTAALSGATVYSINVATGAATSLASSLPGIDNNGWTYDPVIDRFWAVDYGGNIFQYNPTTFARTTFATGQGAHTCMAYVP